ASTTASAIDAAVAEIESGRDREAEDLADRAARQAVHRRAERAAVELAHRVRAKRWTASSNSRLFVAASASSPEASAPATQCCTCSSRILKARLSSAVVTAPICVRTSMQ